MSRPNLTRRTFLHGVCAAGATATAAAGPISAGIKNARCTRSNRVRPPKKLILPTYSSHEEFNADCDFAYVEIDHDRAHGLLERMDLLHEAHRRDGELLKMHFWDCVDFFRYPNSEDEQSTEIPADFEDHLPDYSAEEPWTVLEPSFELPERLRERTECNFLVVYEFGTKDRPNQEIEWQCYPRHTDVRVTTRIVSRKLIEQLACS